MGPSYIWASDDAGKMPDVTAHGWGYALDVMLGGTPKPGLVIGGALLIHEALSPSVSVSGTGNTPPKIPTMGGWLVGPMIDGFPDPDGGFHVGGLLGFAVLSGFPNNGKDPSGGGLSAWVGYQWWTSSEFSLGGVFRFAVTHTVGTASDASDSAQDSRVFCLMLSALYH